MFVAYKHFGIHDSCSAGAYVATHKADMDIRKMSHDKQIVIL